MVNCRGTGNNRREHNSRVEGNGRNFPNSTARGEGLHHIQRVKALSPNQLFQQRAYSSSVSTCSSSASSSSSCGSSDSSDQETHPHFIQQQLQEKKIPLTRKERNRLSAMESRLKKEKLINDLTSRARTLQLENQHLNSLLSQALHLLHSSAAASAPTTTSPLSSSLSSHILSSKLSSSELYLSSKELTIAISFPLF
jgi:hypothetical protein